MYCGLANAGGRSHIVPHGSYLVNLAQDNAAKASQAYNCFLDDLQRSESLGIKLYNFQYAALLRFYLRRTMLEGTDSGL